MFHFKNTDELKNFVANEVLLTNEATSYLGISSQRLYQLVQTGKITPIKTTRSGSLFLKSELYERKFEIEKNYGPGRSILQGVNSIEVINEAINYFTLLTLFKGKYKKCDPIYNHLVTQVNMSNTMDKIAKEISLITGFEENDLLKEETVVRKSFDKLKNDDYVVKIGSDLYPELLEKTDQAPMFLFMRGNPNLLKFNAVSIVGTRNPSESAAKRAQVLAEKFGTNRIVVASGLAKGIDTFAHTGALIRNNPTIAVIGTPLNKYYPKQNENIQKSIEENGLVISQFAPSMNVQRWNFPMRNAVMSGISLATVIIEAGETSGSLIQADYALKQGRMVFIPQSAIENENLSWPKKYIQRNGAFKFSTIDELLNILAENHNELLPNMEKKNTPPASISEGMIDYVHQNKHD